MGIKFTKSSFIGTLKEKFASEGYKCTAYSTEKEYCHIFRIMHGGMTYEFSLAFWYNSGKRMGMAGIWYTEGSTMVNSEYLGKSSSCHHKLTDWNKKEKLITEALDNSGFTIDNVVCWVVDYIKRKGAHP